jgi:hypothetical protein
MTVYPVRRFFPIAGSCLVFLLAPAVAAHAADSDATMDERVAAVVKTGQPALEALARQRAVVQDVKARNAESESPDKSLAFQARWLDPATPISEFRPYLDNNSVLAFRRTMRKTRHLSKVISLDKNGNVVASAPKCHDFAHGFEPKFLSCFKTGNTVVNNPALDLTSKKYSVQVSVPVKDDTGAVLGVLVGTFGIE